MDENIQYENFQKRCVTSSLKMILIVHLLGPQKTQKEVTTVNGRKGSHLTKIKTSVCLLTVFTYKLPFIL